MQHSTARGGCCRDRTAAVEIPERLPPRVPSRTCYSVPSAALCLIFLLKHGVTEVAESIEVDARMDSREAERREPPGSDLRTNGSGRAARLTGDAESSLAETRLALPPASDGPKDTGHSPVPHISAIVCQCHQSAVRTASDAKSFLAGDSIGPFHPQETAEKMLATARGTQIIRVIASATRPVESTTADASFPIDAISLAATVSSMSVLCDNYCVDFYMNRCSCHFHGGVFYMNCNSCHIASVESYIDRV